jgi:hypothetical protein
MALALQPQRAARLVGNGLRAAHRVKFLCHQCKETQMFETPFSLERALRISGPTEPCFSRAGLALRSGRLLWFDEHQAPLATGDGLSLQWGTTSDGFKRSVAVDVLRVQSRRYCVVDGGASLLLTHVLRHSLGGLLWRDNFGASALVEPGALFVHHGREEALVELSPAFHGEPCECVNLVLRTDSVPATAIRLGAHEHAFCNSAEACLRVMLGRYGKHLASALPLPRASLLDIDLAPFAELELPLQADEWGLAVLTSGTLQRRGALLEPWCAIVFAGHEPIVRLATQTGASLLWLTLPGAAP